MGFRIKYVGMCKFLSSSFRLKTNNALFFSRISRALFLHSGFNFCKACRNVFLAGTDPPPSIPNSHVFGLYAWQLGTQLKMKWYIESDPFLALRPFPADPSNQFVEHWHEVVFFTVFYHAVMLAAPAFNSKVFGKFYDDLAQKDPSSKLNYDIRVVSLVQAILSVIFCIPMFLHPMFSEDPVRGSYPFAGFVSAFSVGYFVWDLLYCCVFHFEMFGVEFLFHALGALLVFSATFIPFCQPYLCAFLIFELSTPFVQLHWMFTRSPKGMWSDKIITINGVFLITTFFLARIIWGVYATIQSFLFCWPQREYYPFWLIPIIYILNGGFQFLNFMWFSKMIKLATRMLGGGSSKKSEKKEE